MKTRFKIIIPIIIILIVFSFLFLRSADDALLICEDRFLNSEQCYRYLNDKYKTMSAVNHFLKMSDYEGLGMEVENFQVRKMSASSIENRLVSHMEIDIATSTVVYKCMVLENHDDVFVNIENPTIEDIDNNRCSSFDTTHLKSVNELRCEQIGGNLKHPEFEGCVVESFMCEGKYDDLENTQACKTGLDMCRELGGNVIECMPCKDSVKTQFEEMSKPSPCDFRCLSGCEFPR